MSPVIRACPSLTIQPLSLDLAKKSLLGAEVILSSDLPQLISPQNLTPEDVSVLRQALYDHSVLVIKKQKGIEPSTLPQLAKIWDEKIVDMHSGGSKAVTDPKNILSRNAAVRTPSCRNVTVIGNGQFDGYMGIEKLNLIHVNHTEFHETPLSYHEIENGQTRFYRWHMDMPCYETLPGKVTLIHGIEIPKAPDQKVVFEDGSILPLTAGATAFVSGALAFSLLSPEEQIFALNTVVQYAPRPYEWIRNCKATSDGLTIAGAGNEIPLDELPPWKLENVQSHPMVWRNPGRPSQPHLQILGACVRSLKTTDSLTGESSSIDDLDEVRRICRSLMKKAISADYIYAHAWEEGDLVIFHNQGVLHSITGQLKDEKRLLWQCTMASSAPPEKLATEW
ncbi:alpha-ketoglutarate dependent xanthine dioxygenase [Cadophora sp. MPI-SDFR-AT-0126]|nr:alpha-ketoglutarate dependent xanthine dioxygenase [Leotiomycetes sp. MPI-SDFR-AT-0126]